MHELLKKFIAHIITHFIEKETRSRDYMTRLRLSSRGWIHIQDHLTLEPLEFYGWLGWLEYLSCLVKTITFRRSSLDFYLKKLKTKFNPVGRENKKTSIALMPHVTASAPLPKSRTKARNSYVKSSPLPSVLYPSRENKRSLDNWDSLSQWLLLSLSLGFFIFGNNIFCEWSGSYWVQSLYRVY